jgi:hypothetical protein
VSTVKCGVWTASCEGAGLLFNLFVLMCVCRAGLENGEGLLHVCQCEGALVQACRVVWTATLLVLDAWSTRLLEMDSYCVYF